jgi:DNA-binding transcriptional LysR family regulator
VEQPLQVAATSALSAGLLPAVLHHMNKHSPLNPHIHFRSAPPEDVVRAVLNGTVDVGASSLPLEHRGLHVHWIGQAFCVAELPTNDPACQQDVVSLSSLSGRRFITMANPYRLHGRLDQALMQQSTKAAGVIETNSSLNALSAVRAGLGVAVVEPITAYGALLPGVAIRPLDVDIPFFFGVVTPQSKLVPAVVQRLIDALAHVAGKLLPGYFA